MLRLVIGRAPPGFAFFLGCLALSALFEMLRFEERRGWMTAFASGFVCLVAVCWGLFADGRRGPCRSCSPS